MTDAFSLPQIIGYVAFVITVAAFWQKRDKPLLLLNALSTIFWAAQYAMMGAWVGMVTELLVGVRSVISAYIKDRKQQHLSAAVFLSLFLVAGILAYRQPYDVLNIAACLCGTAAMIYGRDFTLRYGLILATVLWLIYNGMVGTIGGVMTGLVLVATQVATLLRMFRDKRKMVP